ncbi:hypothetical protein K438DRAFT_1904014 [Mycena galopus ATCC 62051]|nr:hypothetical protein K438DRAFT_1904014 [Mycena galopus ATCC 62051]
MFCRSVPRAISDILLLFAFLYCVIEKGSTVTLLLRSPSAFDGDATIQKYVKSGHARLVKGDASIEADTQRAWDEAGVVDAVIFTVGTIPSFSITKGFVQTPADLCTRCVLNPKFVVISGSGIGADGHKSLPLPLKPLYAILLPAPHRDKVTMERVIFHCAGWTWNDKTHGTAQQPSWATVGGSAGATRQGSTQHALIIRPSLLTDGDCVADKTEGTGKKSYRVSEKGLPGGYTISRKDVAHLIFDALTRRWNEFDNKRVNVTY